MFFPAEAPRSFPENPLRHAPLLRYALLFTGGIWAAWWLREDWEQTTWAALAVLLLLLTFGATRIRNGGLWMCLTGGLTVMCFGGLRLTTALHEVQTEWPEEARNWKVRITSIHKHYGTSVTSADAYIIATDRQNTAYSGRQIRLRLNGTDKRQVHPGDVLLLAASVRKPYGPRNPGAFDYRQYLLTLGISGTAYLNEKQWTKSHATAHPSFRQRLLQLRETCAQRFSLYFSEKERAILSALTLGDKSMLNNELRRPFRDSGTSHILALSGMHLGILFSLLHLAFLRFIRNRRLYILAQVLTVLSLWFFVFLAGAPISLQRAAWMLTLWQVGSIIRCGQGGTMNSLSLAALFILCVSPLSLFDVGFQLSFTAVLSIHLMQMYVWRMHPLPEHVITPDISHLISHYHQLPAKSRMHVRAIQAKHVAYNFFRQVIYPFFTVSLSAQLGTAPLVIWHFHQFPLYGLIGNIIVIPATYLILSASLLFLLIPSSVIQSLLAALLSGVLRLMVSGLDHITQWGGAVIQLHLHPGTLICFVLLCCTLLLFTSRPIRERRRWIYLAAFFITCGAVCELYRLRPHRMNREIWVYHAPKGAAVHFFNSAGESYYFSSQPAEAAHRTLSNLRTDFFIPDGIAEPQRITTASFRQGRLLRYKSFFSFHGHTLMLLNHQVNLHQVRALPRTATVIIDRSCYNRPEEIIRTLHPEQIVLLPNLSYRRAKQWKTVCQRAGISCHDIRHSGAFHLKLP